MSDSRSNIFEGRTLEEAVNKGLSALRLTRAEAMITVMQEGSAGFPGFGSRPFRGRVGGAPSSEAGGGPREEHRGGNERGGGGGRRARAPGGGGGEGGRGPTPMPTGGDEPVERRDDRQPGFGMRGFEDRRRPGDRREEGGLPPSELGDRRWGDERRGELSEPRDDQEGDDAGRRRRRGRRGGRRRHRGEGGAAPMTGSEPMAPVESDEFAPDVERPMAELPGSPSPIDDEESMANDESDRGYAPGRREREERHDREERREPQGEAMSGEQLEALPRQVTEDLMRAMGFAATVTVTPEDAEKMNVTVQVTEGEDLLTGRKGETRQALQHLINRMVNRGEGSRYHVQLEINDFWAQREKELEGQARQMADDAVSSGNEQVTDYLNAQERRIIHVTLREDSRVRTYAIGDGMIKRLAVAPAQFAETTEPLEY